MNKQMNLIDQFRQTVQNLRDTAITAGADPRELRRVLVELAGVDVDAAQEAAERLGDLIDGEEDDDLGAARTPARNILRAVFGA